jgi:hypothetical protein
VIEDAAVEVVVSVAVEAADMEKISKKMTNQPNRIGVVMDEAVVKVADHTVQILNATIVASMDTLQKSAIPKRRWRKTRI